MVKNLFQVGYMLIDSCYTFCMFFVLLFHPGLRFHVKRDLFSLIGIKQEEIEQRGKRRVGGLTDQGVIYFQQLDQVWKRNF